MAFRLPGNLTVGGQYRVVSPGDVAALEESLSPQSRMLVGIAFSEKYEGFLNDCEQAEAVLSEAGIPPWPEYSQLVTPDPDGEPVVWISYLSSPAWWTLILITIGGIFLLPVLSILPTWIMDNLYPGLTEIIMVVIALEVMGGVMVLMPKMLSPAEVKK